MFVARAERQAPDRTSLGFPADIDSALKLLPTLTGPARRILKVELYNSVPAAESPAASWLAELGFVRDYPGMA